MSCRRACEPASLQALGYGGIAKYGNTGVEWHSAFAFVFAFETTKGDQ